MSEIWQNIVYQVILLESLRHTDQYYTTRLRQLCMFYWLLKQLCFFSVLGKQHGATLYTLRAKWDYCIQGVVVRTGGHSEGESIKRYGHAGGPSWPGTWIYSQAEYRFTDRKSLCGDSLQDAPTHLPAKQGDITLPPAG